MAKLFAVDLDGTLTKDPCWTKEQCLLAEPRKEIIKLVNKLYKDGNIIVIWTARREYLRPETEYWLRVNEVFFHALNMNKLGADAYIDDRAINSLNYDYLSKEVESVLLLPAIKPKVD